MAPISFCLMLTNCQRFVSEQFGSLDQAMAVPLCPVWPVSLIHRLFRSPRIPYDPRSVRFLLCCQLTVVNVCCKLCFRGANRVPPPCAFSQVLALLVFYVFAFCFLDFLIELPQQKINELCCCCWRTQDPTLLWCFWPAISLISHREWITRTSHQSSDRDWIGAGVQINGCCCCCSSCQVQTIYEVLPFRVPDSVFV